MILPITLTIAGAAALINIWLMIRVGQVRSSEKVSIGDGGNENVIRRMRAHSNYIESARKFASDGKGSITNSIAVVPIGSTYSPKRARERTLARPILIQVFSRIC